MATINKNMFVWMPPNNKRTCCPPGELRPQKGKEWRKNILVASLPRSGTHLLIDLIINNFSPYRRNPLYVDVDHFLDNRKKVIKLVECGGYIVKTHFPSNPDFPPQTGSSENFDLLRESSLVFRPVRVFDKTFMSMTKMWNNIERDRLEKMIEQFENYWKDYPVELFPFSDMVAPNNIAPVIRLARLLGMPTPSTAILPPRKGEKNEVFIAKMLTRMLGRWSPRVNTTIGFGK